jgi:molecular chaperone DnaK
LDQVLLVGGSTRSPIVPRLLEERLRQPAHQEVDPDLCVAMGAAVQAAMIGGLEVGPVLVDITPHSLGIRCLGMVQGQFSDTVFSRIITRNTPLPASRSEVYQTIVDGQERVQIEVFQGEADNVLQNTSVGEFAIEGLADVPAGNEVMVHMNLTLDGILRVTATEKHTGLQRQVRIENALARFQRDDRDEALDRLELLFETQSPGQDADDAAVAVESPRGGTPPETLSVQRAVVRARAVLEKAERLLPSIEPEEREELDAVIERLRQAITVSQLADIEVLSTELDEALFYLEDI